MRPDGLQLNTRDDSDGHQRCQRINNPCQYSQNRPRELSGMNTGNFWRLRHELVRNYYSDARWRGARGVTGRLRAVRHLAGHFSILGLSVFVSHLFIKRLL